MPYWVSSSPFQNADHNLASSYQPIIGTNTFHAVIISFLLSILLLIFQIIRTIVDVELFDN